MRLFQAISGVAVRHLPSSQVKWIRNSYRASERYLHPLKRWFYGTFDTEDLRTHLSEEVGTNFEILMVHSSINHMQPCFTDGPLEFVRMLMEFCGPDRTLVMPAFYFGDPSIGGAYRTFQQKPLFDLRRTPSQMGLATELFRRTRGALQSRHPIYRVSALGPMAADLVAGHESAGSALGVGTPFGFMDNHDTLILGIGKPFDVLTHVHHAEEMMGARFPVPRRALPEPIEMTLVEGEEEVPFTLRGGGFKWQRRMSKLRRIMDSEALREWRFHGVPFFRTRAHEVTRALTEAAMHGRTIYQNR